MGKIWVSSYLTVSLSFVLIIVLLIVLLIYTFKYFYNFIYYKNICSSLDGRCYNISTKFDKNTYIDASDRLAYLNIFSITLIKHLRNKYVFNNAGNNYMYYMVIQLLKNYDPNNIIENTPKTNVNTSYVEDKGKVFAICLREKITGDNNIHDKHTLEFILLHELAHLASYNYGHGYEYWTNFKILINEAYIMGLHDPIDYSLNPVNYCSLVIDYNPYFDNNLII